MYLENVVLDALDPERLGPFWEGLLGARSLTVSPDAVEMRLDLPGGHYLDLCIVKVPEPAGPSPRLHLDLRGGDEQDAVVRRALALGGRYLDIGQLDVPWVVLADPEGTPFCVMEDRESYRRTGPVAALPLDSADPAADAAIWALTSGWQRRDADGFVELRHPSGTGPVLELLPQGAAKEPGAKNRLHLDARLEPGEDADTVVEQVTALGGREVDFGWGDLPWRTLQDASGNELCLLPARG
ncbi:VOC family protein [Phycicoccus sp. CSK15P-2]|uniref:VOC family protein n=1 Tax=Phycicoccus sp. CSK15P-2 TaxID=2807627 RepID=UPI00194F8D95|nr:VOC family protein [Phycicoccus sp. CSK15P-2]MBM6403715.1 VOC family protein [Phycicoccus sp. CSK15P-2]